MTAIVTDFVIPDEMARAAVLPESYKDEKNLTYPASKWLRQNNPLGMALLAGFDLPGHTTIRRLINAWFRPANVKRFTDQVRERAKRAVDALFARDDEVDFGITIDRGKHAGFGFGPHQCQGMMIARLELKILFEELLPRLGSIELNGEPKYTQTNFVGGLKSLPVRTRQA